MIQDSPERRKIAFALVSLLTILSLGTIGYHYLEGWSMGESLYTTVTTLSTVGYGDYYPKSKQGMAFTVFLIITGVGTMLYTMGLFAEIMIKGQLRTLLGKGRLEKMISKMRDHYIICGCGRIGQLICQELATHKIPFVVIDNNQEVIEKTAEWGYVYLKGDATQEKTLLAAGIKQARGIVCVLSTDAANLYVILTARELNPQMFILSRAEDSESEQRMLKAGANRVETPYIMGGMRMAMAILRPAMLDFIELTTMKQSLELRMEEIPICENSNFIGKTLEEARIKDDYGLIIVAVKKETGKMIFNPISTYLIEKNDHLIALGEINNINAFSSSCLG